MCQTWAQSSHPHLGKGREASILLTGTLMGALRPYMLIDEHYAGFQHYVVGICVFLRQGLSTQPKLALNSGSSFIASQVPSYWAGATAPDSSSLWLILRVMFFSQILSISSKCSDKGHRLKLQARALNCFSTAGTLSTRPWADRCCQGSWEGTGPGLFYCVPIAPSRMSTQPSSPQVESLTATEKTQLPLTTNTHPTVPKTGPE